MRIYATSGGGSMAYNKEEWMAKMDKAQTDEEITALIMELPNRGPPMPEGDPESLFMERRQTSRRLTSAIKTGKTPGG
jgi:hypothetical protein